MSRTPPAIPKGALLLGFVDGQAVYLTVRDRSVHILVIGASGTGKTTALEGWARQDITSRSGLTVVDPMGALYDRLLRYFCYLRGTGRSVPDVLLLNASQPDWVLPFNPFQRRDGDLSVQVDRRVAAMLRAWGQHHSDYTPRLEKWLKIDYHALIECGLTMLEAGALIDRHGDKLRQYLLTGISQPLIRSKLKQLDAYRDAEFLQQTESVENRLMRFLVSGTMRRLLGTGQNALDFRAIMDRGQALLVKLAVSGQLSREQRRLIGTLILGEYFETALERPSGARPHYLYVDEAAEFVSPDMGEALETCRQKGLHLILSFQHLSQFRTGSDDRLYKAVKNNARNKVVFAVPDRKDAEELADDLIPGLAEPAVKYTRRHLNHLLKDVRQESTTETEGSSRSVGQSQSRSTEQGESFGQSHGGSLSYSRTRQQGANQSRTFSRGKNQQTSHSQGRTESEHEAHSSGFSESRSRQSSSSENSSDTVYEGRSEGWLAKSSDDRHAHSSGQSSHSSSGYSRSETGSDSYDRGSSETESSSSSKGSSSTLAFSRTRQYSTSSGRTFSRTWQDSQTQSRSTAEGQTDSRQQGDSRSRSVTDQPGTLHLPFWEEQPEFWRLDEQRWKAAELIMRQGVGHSLFCSADGRVGELIIREPRKIYLLPQTEQRLTEEFYARHCITKKQAEHLIASRQAALRAAVLQHGQQPALPQGGAAGQAAPGAPASIWNRAAAAASQSPAAAPLPAAAGKRGPKPDAAMLKTVAQIVSAAGADWSSEKRLAALCEQLDKHKVPVPRPWPTRPDVRARSWTRALEARRDLVVKAITDRLKMAQALGG